MYLGRIVSVGLTHDEQFVVMYRVSSRSYPNRTIQPIGKALAVVPKPGFETDIFESPYIAYNCLRHNSQYAVVGNGTQTDPVFEKLETGMSVRDALISVLYGMDYEHDRLGTPRIVAVADRVNRTAALGVIRQDGLEVKMMPLSPGQYVYVSTYQHNNISCANGGMDLRIASVAAACEFVLHEGAFSPLTHPVAAAAAFEHADGFEIAHQIAALNR